MTFVFLANAKYYFSRLIHIKRKPQNFSYQMFAQIIEEYFIAYKSFEGVNNCKISDNFFIKR